MTFINKSEETTDTTYHMDENGNISLENGSKLGIVTPDGEMVIEGGENVSVKMTDTGLEVTVNPGEKVCKSGIGFPICMEFCLFGAFFL